jgi:hypothetical protein
MIPTLESLFAAPNGPDMPFGTPALIVLDSLRMLILVLGVFVILMTPACMIRSRLSGGQLMRFFSLGLFVVIAITTEYSHIGDYANFRLVLNIIAAITAAWGVWSLFRYEEGSNAKA